jgi:chemotaxis signal transduction protein
MLQEGTRTEVKRIFIILSFNNRLRAVPVDNAEEICDVAYDRIMPVPKTILDRKENRILNGIAVLKDKMIPLIDHSVLFKVAVTDPLF